MAQETVRIKEPLTLQRKPVAAAYQADRQRTYTVLTIDGGGMRAWHDPRRVGSRALASMAAKHAD
jgi:hypothetical protein